MSWNVSYDALYFSNDSVLCSGKLSTALRGFLAVSREVNTKNPAGGLVIDDERVSM